MIVQLRRLTDLRHYLAHICDLVSTEAGDTATMVETIMSAPTLFRSGGRGLPVEEIN